MLQSSEEQSKFVHISSGQVNTFSNVPASHTPLPQLTATGEPVGKNVGLLDGVVVGWEMPRWFHENGNNLIPSN